ncbi:hypothetical protein [Lysobacter capsici]|uniref:hypothetical protein n=1 Tax=Lysobacter capsici TaxID=435897 RepID=UPI001C005953|nr:hypothetical protein [Lysobacter capsici]QWF16105.1 hypothetical protein KME82_20440 [Lysobacter capsici]
MSTELRNRFDQTLQTALHDLSFDGLALKAGKRKLRVSAQGEAVAELSFVHLARADGVHLLARVFDGATCRALKALDLSPLNIVLWDPTALRPVSPDPRFCRKHGQQTHSERRRMASPDAQTALPLLRQAGPRRDETAGIRTQHRRSPGQSTFARQ